LRRIAPIEPSILRLRLGLGNAHHVIAKVGEGGVFRSHRRHEAPWIQVGVRVRSVAAVHAWAPAVRHGSRNMVAFSLNVQPADLEAILILNAPIRACSVVDIRMPLEELLRWLVEIEALAKVRSVAFHLLVGCLLEARLVIVDLPIHTRSLIAYFFEDCSIDHVLFGLERTVILSDEVTIRVLE